MATTKTDSPFDLERRKLVRIRLRRDLKIEAQKYEGRTFFVMKDPVSLRYYRLKENEHFLLQYMNGQDTLDDAQKAYEQHYRPERLKLEDLEAFAQQMIKAGLAQNDSPKAGQQLFENRKKRRRTELIQTFTNILYIKIPLFDPDRLLKRMLNYLGWIFTTWFFVLSLALMGAAVLLVTLHFETFRAKLPNYHEFFSFKTVVYLWASLAVVKVIHEFGHGLSCKRFGGEVHQMGLLFLCLSPAMFCNVSDAWKLPNKWHRIIISFAGIYVELVIASLATFLWWNTSSQPFVNNLSLSLMVVCSVSTVVFNANPLMRYDGYYVVADWLEIPNLREKSNRFLSNLALKYCLGVETQPEPYMQLRRRILFVTYAVVSYVYRWIVTFTILWFMYNFLRPYKLEVLSTMLAIAALASMVGWPLFRLGKNIYRRGRLPDMKQWRVVLTTCVVAGILFFLFFVPVPISRIRGTGLVQTYPENSSTVFIHWPGILEKLNVHDGQEVRRGEILAEFTSRELQAEIGKARTEVDRCESRLRTLTTQLNVALDPSDRGDLSRQMNERKGDLTKAVTDLNNLLRTKERLVLLAPRAGIVSGAPRLTDIGKTYERDPNSMDPSERDSGDRDPNTPLCTIAEPGRLRVCLPVETPEFNQLKENVEQLTPRAAAAFRALRKRVTVAFAKSHLREVLDELNKKVPEAHFEIDQDKDQPSHLAEETVTYEATKRPLSEVLDAVLGRLGAGFVITSMQGDPQDGSIVVRPGRDRGFADNERMLVDLPVTIRIHGRDSQTWQGRVLRLPESDARDIPMALSSRAGGPVAVKGNTSRQTLIPQTQHYLVYVDILDPDAAITPGSMAQVKIHCRPETVASWVWRKVNDMFNLGLL